MPLLPEKPSLKDLQKHIKDLCKERGWDKNSHLEIFLLFMEEVGELAKAMRAAENLYYEEGKETDSDLEEEFADVLNYLLDLANYFKVDLETAFRKKDAVNNKRQWKGKV
ncbi:MAG: MazG nucleotide pyrophosphohydrolase domain-containing protein [Bacteroidota bacterium]